MAAKVGYFIGNSDRNAYALVLDLSKVIKRASIQMM